MNVCALTKIIHFIRGENINPMRPWSERFKGNNRQNWYLRKLTNQTREILNIISGNNIVDMLKGNKIIYNWKIFVLKGLIYSTNLMFLAFKITKKNIFKRFIVSKRT